MKRFFKMLFFPHDGTRQTIKDEVVASRVAVEVSANKFEQAISDLLASNDSLRQGRNRRNERITFE